MSENKVSETKLAEQQARAAEASEARCQPSGHLVWKIIGGAVLALVAAGVITNLHDIKRYIRISTM
ncbi:MAG TPA: hypothetical protein VGN90_16820 [Pyrinomonadaceae bacterium]|jgi:hypothetical protein|nr:hypothetical protein [Pyrinomonadaceae bacterium]